MAGEWIKVEHHTPDKPEVLKMAEVLGTSPDDVFGKLFRVWCWFDTQSLNGHAGSETGVTLFKFIDRLVASQGFATTMKSVGWLTDDGIPNFDYHNGESAKKRALSAKRQRKHRNASVTLEASPEKRREEKKEEQGATTQGRKKASRITPDWRLSTEQIAWAIETRPEWTPEDVLVVGEKFRDFWLAKPDGAKLDWDATWRNWVRGEGGIKRDRQRRQGNGVVL
jgi:hypothetical protein